MIEIKTGAKAATRSLLGLVMAGSLFTFAACGGNGGNGISSGNGSNGNNENGGNGGGINLNATASGGVGGGGMPRGCTASAIRTAPADGLIADFMGSTSRPDAGGIEVMGGIITYGGDRVGGPGAPRYTTSGGTLEITESAAATAEPQYLGLVVYFVGCVDASVFTGVEFTISGSFSGCTMQYYTEDSAHQDSTRAMGPPYAAGPAGAYSPQADIEATGLTSMPAKMSMPFAGAGAPSGGSPDGVALDPTRLTGVAWQLTVPAAVGGGTSGDAGASSAVCTASLTIDDVKLYR